MRYLGTCVRLITVHVQVTRRCERFLKQLATARYQPTPHKYFGICRRLSRCHETPACRYLFRRSISSRLTGKFADVARSSAPAAAEKTDKSRGSFTPKAIVIVSAKLIRRTPLSKAVMRVFQPRTRRSPKRVSAAVAIIATAGIIADGKNQSSFAV